MTRRKRVERPRTGFGEGHAGGSAGCGTGAYTYTRALTVQGAQVSSTQTAFPVSIAGTYSWLATVGNGGRLQSASGLDVNFYSDSTHIWKDESRCPRGVGDGAPDPHDAIIGYSTIGIHNTARKEAEGASW